MARDLDVARWLDAWGLAWGVPDLGRCVRIRFSLRLRRSLGRCNMETGDIALHRDLEGDSRLEEVLCHEAAHYAVHRLHGRMARPHGAEWRDLVSRAGFEPKVRLAWGASPPAAPRYKTRYLHRCPVCQMQRTARRPVPAWRCRACVEAGLEGRLAIERVP